MARIIYALIVCIIATPVLAEWDNYRQPALEECTSGSRAWPPCVAPYNTTCWLHGKLITLRCVEGNNDFNVDACTCIEDKP
jgi:hypothetical protein